MPIRSLIFLVLFLVFSIGSLFNPMFGALGYIGHYHIFPEGQWWGLALMNLGIRYSYIIAMMFAIGTIFKIRKLRFKKFFHSQEILLIIFLIIIWLSKYLGLEVDEDYKLFGNYPPIKISKVTLFVLLLTHVVCDLKKYKMITWTFVLMGLYLGYSSYTAPASAF
ncbi:MAG: hypothetical protein JW866_00405, partial [Ignavibacteriales bacterium]|nr:hypothetical protein [Ignavibacteriales bacterium]